MDPRVEASGFVDHQLGVDLTKRKELAPQAFEAQLVGSASVHDSLDPFPEMDVKTVSEPDLPRTPSVRKQIQPNRLEEKSGGEVVHSPAAQEGKSLAGEGSPMSRITPSHHT